MSRIGNQPISIPGGVQVSLAGREVTVKGPKGELKMTARPEVTVEVEDKNVQVKPTSGKERGASAYHGLTRSLIQNMVIGVTDGYERKLEINGVGYGVTQQGQKLVFTLGFANKVEYPLPPTVQVECPTATSITVRGADKQQVGLVASELRKLRPPEPYKGKGIKYADEVIRRKAGQGLR